LFSNLNSSIRPYVGIFLFQLCYNFSRLSLNKLSKIPQSRRQCYIFFNVGSMINNSIREYVFINYNLYTQVITNCKISCYIEYSEQREFIDMGKLRP
jgi:hypothetical protein